MQAASAGKFTVLVLYSSQTDSLTEVILQSFLSNVSANDTATADLQLVVHDLNSSSCDEEETTAVGLFIREIFKNEIGAVAVVGPSCTDSAYAISRLIGRGALPMIHLHTSPMPEQLAAQVEEKSFGLLGPVDLLADASIALMQHANWSRIIALYQDTNTDMNFIFLRMQKLLSSGDSNTTLGYSSLVHEGNTHLKFVLSRYAVRIIFLMMDKELARSILCVGYHLEAVYPAYQWVIIGTMPHDLITDEPIHTESYECSKENMLTVLTKAIFIGFEEQFPSLIFRKTFKLLSQTLSHVENTSLSNSLSQAQQGQQAFLFQTHNSELFPVAVHDETDGMHIKSNSTLYLIPNNFTKVMNAVEFHVFAVATVILVILGIVTAILQLITIRYRKTKYIRATSPNVQHLAFLGTYLVIFVTFIYAIQKSLYLEDKLYTDLCIVYRFCFSFGFTLLFGTLCIKAWRLYRIFNHYMDPGKLLSDKILVVVALSLTLLNLVICILWTVIGKTVRTEIPVRTDFQERIEIVNKVCRTRYYAVWISLTLGYQGILLIIAAIFSTLVNISAPKHQDQFRQNEVTFLAYLLNTFFLSAYPTYLVAHYITGNIILEFVVVMALQCSIITAYILLLFAVPLLRAIRHEKLKSGTGHLNVTSGSCLYM